MRIVILLAAAVVVSAPLRAAPAADGEWLVYIGTYTRAPSVGIYTGRFHSATGKIAPIGVAAETVNPTFLAVHPTQRFLYAANEVNTYEGAAAGSASAFAIDRATGKLTLLNTVSSKGPGPCHLSVDKTAKWLYMANYAGGSVAALPVKQDGSLSEAAAFFQHAGSGANPRRQAGPHAHVAAVSPDNRVVLVADLGLDRIFAYRADPAHGLTPNDPPFATLAPGSGPRHVVFGADGKYVYSVNELLSTVTVFRYDAARGSLEELQTLSTLPQGFAGNNSGAEIAVHPSGKFLYASNRGHDSIAIFRIDVRTGKLTAAGDVPTGGKTPRNFALDPSGKFLLAANQDSASVVVFRIDPNSGALTPTGDIWEVPSPVSIVFVRTK